MTKHIFELLINNQISAENEVRNKYNNLISDSNINFYNKLTYVIHKLFEEIYGEKGVELIESFIYDENSMTLEELENLLNNIKKYE